MKSWNKIWPLLLLVLPACNKQLDLAPEDTLVVKDVFRTAAGSEQALAEAYYNLQKAVTGDIAYVFGDFSTPNLLHSTYYDTYDKGNVSPADDPVRNVWTSYYKAINSVNNVIENIPVYGQFDEAIKSKLIAEGKFIRAYAYMDLLKFFGEGAIAGNMQGKGLPLQLTPFKGYNTGDVIPRSSNEDVYNQIISDLRDAVSVLPDQQASDLQTRSRATRGSANALLARVYLYKRDYANAALAAKAVLDKTGIYALTSDLGRLFPMNPNGTAQSLSSEYIFAFPVSQMQSSSTAVNNNLGNGYFFKRSFWINPAFIQSFETGDLRVSQLMFKGDSIYNPDRFGDKTTAKFNNSNGRDNVPLIRLAEIMLIRAEALARGGTLNQEAIDLLNAVRSRSLPQAATFTMSDFQDNAAFLAAVLDQRRYELAFEGFYRYDLIRTGQPLHNPDIPDNKKVLPIPQIEVDISNGVIQQNEGY